MRGISVNIRRRVAIRWLALLVDVEPSSSIRANSRDGSKIGWQEGGGAVKGLSPAAANEIFVECNWASVTKKIVIILWFCVKNCIFEHITDKIFR